MTALGRDLTDGPAGFGRAPTEVAAATLTFTPTVGTGGVVEWACNGNPIGTAGSINTKYVPANCR